MSCTNWSHWWNYPIIRFKTIYYWCFYWIKKGIRQSLLCTKMVFLGIRSVAFVWNNIYLENRKQFAFFDKCNSDVRNISCGVPQGSIFGPKLFILYLNDICNGSNIVKFILFADDTNMFHASSDISRLNETIGCVLKNCVYDLQSIN